MSCEPKLEWYSFPFIERPITSVLLVLFLIALSIFLWKVTVIGWNSPIFYYGGMFLTMGSLLPYFIRTKYEMYEEKVVVYYLWLKIERKYTDFGCFYLDKRGVMLSTFKTPRRLDPFRGMSLRLSARQTEKEQLIAFLKDIIGKQF